MQHHRRSLARRCSAVLLPLALASLTASPTLAKGPKVGPFALSSADGSWSMRLALVAQLLYRMDATDSASGERDVEATVWARRVRPTLHGTALDSSLCYHLHLSTAPGAIELMDLYLDYRLAAWGRVRLGQYKIPFTRFRSASFTNLTLVDWPVVTRYFGSERQMGIAVHNGLEKTPSGLQFEAGVFSGVNARKAHAVGLAQLYGERLQNPSDLADPGPRAALHPELVAHLAYNLGPIDVGTDTDWRGGALRLSAGLGATWDLDPERTADLTLRIAPELLLKWRGASLSASLYLGFARDLAGDGLADQRLGLMGGSVQCSYLFARRLELALRYALVHVDAGLARGARARARALITAAADEASRSALSEQYGAAGQLEQEHEANLGLNAYLIGRSLKLQSDVSWLIHQQLERRLDDIRLRVQLQLAI